MNAIAVTPQSTTVRRAFRLAFLLLGVWTAVHLHLAVMSAADPRRGTWPEALVAVAIHAMVWAAATSLLFPLARRLQRERRLRDIAVLIVVLPLLASTMGLVDLLVRGSWPRDQVVLIVAAAVAPFPLAIAVFAVVLAVLLAGREELSERERRRFELETLLMRSRAEHLRARLSPPFLFGVMDAIARSIEPDPDEAEQILERFAELLRTIVDLERETAITLEQELEIIDRFVELSSGDCRLTLTADDVALDVAVPPLILYSVVAAVAAEHARQIAVDARAAEDLHVTVSVPMPADPKPIAERLVSTGDRLRHLYPGRQRLRTRATRDLLEIAIVLPRARQSVERA